MEVVFQDTDGRQLAKLEGLVTPEWREDLPPGWKVGAMLGLNFNVPLPGYGLYSFEILVNDNSVKSLGLRVVPAQGSRD